MGYDPISVQSGLAVRLGVTSTGAMSIGSNAFHDLDGHMQFTAADIGEPMFVIGALSPDGSTLLVSHVTAVADATHCTLADNATRAPDASANATLFRPRGLPLSQGGLNAQWSLTTHDTLQVVFYDQLPRPKLQTPILITVLGVDEFGGTLDNVLGEIEPGTLDALSSPAVQPLVKWTCDAVSWDKWIYRRTTGEPTVTSGSPAVTNPDSGTFTNMTVKQIMQFLVTNALGSDGIQMDPAAVDGPVIPSFNVSYAQVGDAFDQLIKAGSDAGAILHWFTDAHKVVHLDDNSTIDAPWDVDQMQIPQSLQSVVSMTWDRSEFVDRVYVRLGAFIADAMADPPGGFKGDGVTRTFTLSGAAALAPTITLNGGAQTVGVLGVDTGKDWYWQAGSTQITQDPSGTILTSSDTLLVIVSEFDTAIVLSANQPVVDASSAIEGGTGFYESVQQTNVPSTTTDGKTLAAAIASQFGVIPRKFAGSTYRPGLRIGQTQHIKIAAYDCDDDFVIDSVTLTADDNILLWSYTAMGSPLIDWNYKATLARLRPGAGETLGTAGTPSIPWNAIAILPGTQTVATDVTANHRRTTVNLDGAQVNLLHIYVTAKVAPASQSFIADWLVSSDGGLHWISILPAGSANKIVLPTGQTAAAIVPASWALNPIQEGWIHRVDVLQVDASASGIEIELYGGIS